MNNDLITCPACGRFSIFTVFSDGNKSTKYLKLISRVRDGHQENVCPYPDCNYIFPEKAKIIHTGKEPVQPGRKKVAEIILNSNRRDFVYNTLHDLGFDSLAKKIYTNKLTSAEAIGFALKDELRVNDDNRNLLKNLHCFAHRFGI